MNKPKILMTASTFPRYEGDTEPRFVLDLAKALTDKYEVTVLVPSFPGAEKSVYMEGVRVERYRYAPLKSMETLCYPGAVMARIKAKKIRILLLPLLFVGLWNYLRIHRHEYDLVHAHWVIPQGIVQSFFKKPYIITGHGGDIMSLNVGPIKALKKKAFVQAKKLVVVSEPLAKKVQEIAPGVSPEIISMGCDTSSFSPKHRKEEYFGQKGQKVILFVGRLEEVKGVSYLINAMQYIDGKLVIVGTGSEEQMLKEQAKVFGDRIEFVGAKTHEELQEIYASADVFVMSSVTTKSGAKEGFGLVMLEAMASGLPVVAFASGGIPQLLAHEYNGLLCEEKNVEQLAENIKTALYNQEIRDKLVANGYQTVAAYDYKEIAKRYERIYAEAMHDEGK